MKSKHTFRLSPGIASQLAELAIRKRVSQAEIVETALMSYMTPDGPERMEAAFSRRIDNVLRKLDKLDYRAELTSEALALFVRFWLTANPPIPDSAIAMARARGQDRFEGFVQALARRMDNGPKLSDAIVSDSLD